MAYVWVAAHGWAVGVGVLGRHVDKLPGPGEAESLGNEHEAQSTVERALGRDEIDDESGLTAREVLDLERGLRPFEQGMGA